MTVPETSGPLRVERPSEGVVVLTLALPERRNAMTEELTAAWAEAVGGLAADRSVRAVVVTGEGSAFCAGGDLSWIDAGGAEVDALRTKMRAFYLTWLSIRELEVPVIAAVNGPAIGAGLCLALACDLRYAAPTARFGAPFAALGMHPGMAASYLIPEAVGMPRAREMLYTGRIYGAEEAAEIGLINGSAAGGNPARRGGGDRGEGRGDGARRGTADQSGAAPRPSLLPRGHRVGGSRAADHDGDRRHAGGLGRPGRAAQADVRGPLTRRSNPSHRQITGET